MIFDRKTADREEENLDLKHRAFELLGAARVVDEALAPKHRRGFHGPEDGVTYIYFIRAGRYGPIKIGLTRNPDQRMRELQNGNAYQLRLLRAIPGDRQMEARLHTYFGRIRLAGEWFEGSQLFEEFVQNPLLEEALQDGLLVPKGHPEAAVCTNCGVNLRAAYGVPLGAIPPGSMLDDGGICPDCQEFAELREQDGDPFEKDEA